jgi:OOP family OmpA-OmpF porin
MPQFEVNKGGLAKRLPALAVIVVLVLGFIAYNQGWIKGRFTNKVEVTKIAPVAGNFKKDTNYTVAKVPLPSGDELAGKMFLTCAIYDWHANSALVYANGGERTLENSLIGKEGLVIKLVHQDDTNVSIKTFLEKATELKTSGGASGANFCFTIMGNSSVPLIEPIQAALKLIDPSYRAVAIDLYGKSNGEDQLIGPIEWKTNCDLMRGRIVVGVYDDGDVQGPGVMYAQKCGVPVNFDYHTYNPHALNIEAVADFITAGKVFLHSKELDPRPVVDDKGIRTGKTTKDLKIILSPDSLASWTPVDRNIVAELSQTDPGRLKGLATINSTGSGEEYKIMPATVIVLNKFEDNNLEKLVNLSYAVHMAAMQIDKYPDALQKTSELNTALLGVWDGDANEKVAANERLRAFNGYVNPKYPDIHIGGSAVFSIRDAMNMVGMNDVGDDLANSTAASVYRSIGDLTIEHYPEKNLRKYTPFEQFFDPRVLRGAYRRAQSEGNGGTELLAKRQYSESDQGEKVGSANFQITFKPGSADFGPAAYKTLKKIQDQYAPNEYSITVTGHTDRTGTDAVNIPLSHARADAVKQYLVNANKAAFGGERISTDGKGSTEPAAGVDPNYTGANEACRRVEITIYR